ncbi:MAG: hypothetical protein CMN50_09640 [SAR116 cluster bacterium]|nr:hypothetical protein [SAR116 cluster bacterium]
MINIQNFFYLFFLLFICEKVLANDYNSLIVEADNSIEYFEKEKYYLASGNAIATKNGVTLKADKIKAFFEKNINDNEIKLIFGIGNVKISKNKIRAEGNHVVYDLYNETIKFINGYQFFKTEDIFIESNKILLYDNKISTAKGKGKVKIILKKNIKIFADEVKAIFNKKDDSLQEAIGTGNIKIYTKSSKTFAEKANYKRKSNIILLEENVRIFQDNLSIVGQSGLTNLNTGVSRILSNNKKQRVKGKFTTSKKK